MRAFRCPPSLMLIASVVGIEWVSTSSLVTGFVVNAPNSRCNTLPTLQQQQQRFHSFNSLLIDQNDMKKKHPLSHLATMTTTNSKKRSSSTHLSMVSYEQLLEKLPSNAVIDAVEGSPNDRVIASDVAAKAGVSITQARKDLTALASLSEGDIAVSNDGELIYSFPANLKGVLSSKSAKFKAVQTFEKTIWPPLFWAIRASFGVALIASIAIIFSAIFFLQTSSSSDDDRRDDRRGGGFGGGYNMIWGPSPFDFFYYRPYGYYGYYGTGTNTEEYRDPDKMGFLESVFSYIFGDGNPNQGLEEKRLSLAANMIRSNKGAVTAEQLAPYVDAPNPKDTSSPYVDESFVLPIVSQLDGEPRVTDDGDIIYVFPDLQLSTSTVTSQSLLSPKVKEASILRRAGLSPNASTRDIQQLLYMNRISTRGAMERKDLLSLLEDALPPISQKEENELLQDDPTLLQEREYEFSLAPDLYKFFAGGLGIVNLGGALYLGNLFNQYNLYGVQLPSVLGIAQTFYPLLLGYAILFNLIPLVRNFYVGSQNSKIRERNIARQKWRDIVSSKLGNIAKKLKAASQFKTRTKQLRGDDIVYDMKTTSTDDLKVERQQQELDEFDKLLGKSSINKKKMTNNDEDDTKNLPFQ